MSSRCLRLAALALVALGLAAGAARAGEPPGTLRVCADPNNLPFSNAQGEGFENRIARLIAADLGVGLAYTWWAQRRGFIRNTLNARACDLVVGVPADDELTLTTRPYYRSSYVALARDPGLRVAGLDDPVLRQVRIGVQIIGDDFANTPPAHGLSRRGMVENVRGYLVYGNYAEASPSAAIVRAVALSEVDVALVWGPLAGYFAAREKPPLALTPLAAGGGDLPFEFAIAMGVRRQDRALRDRLDEVLERRAAEIDRILAEYHVPRLDGPAAAGSVR
jgi:mxaJ protein